MDIFARWQDGGTELRWRSTTAANDAGEVTVFSRRCGAPGAPALVLVPGADHYVQCDAPEQLAQIVRLAATGEDIGLQTLGNQPDGAVLVDQSGA